MLRLRMISLVSILMLVSMFCSMVTDVQFYIDKLRDKHSAFKGLWTLMTFLKSEVRVRDMFTI